jgi:hypothetical protein
MGERFIKIFQNCVFLKVKKKKEISKNDKKEKIVGILGRFISNLLRENSNRTIKRCRNQRGCMSCPSDLRDFLVVGITDGLHTTNK